MSKQAISLGVGTGAGAVVGYFVFSNPATGAVVGLAGGIAYAVKIGRDDAKKRQEEKARSDAEVRAVRAENAQLTAQIADLRSHIANQNNVIADLRSHIANQDARIANQDNRFESVLTALRTQHNISLNLTPSATVNNAQNVQQTTSNSQSR
jgi:hypothetical protein